MRFKNDAGWELTDAAVESVGLTLPAGRLDARVSAFEVTGRRLESLEGYFEYSCERIAAGTLSAWLEAASLAGLRESDAPRYFENVHVAARFELKDAVVAVEPLEGRPALVWAEVNGETIILSNGPGRVGLDEFLAKAARIPPQAEAEKPAEEAEP